MNGERGQRAVLVGRHQEAGLEHRLEAVADAEDELLVVAELAEGVGEEVLHVDRLHLPGPHVVAVGEAAGQDEDLVVAQEPGVVAEGVEVDAVAAAADHLEGLLHLVIAVGSRGTQDECVRRGHDENAPEGTSLCLTGTRMSAKLVVTSVCPPNQWA